MEKSTVDVEHILKAVLPLEAQLVGDDAVKRIASGDKTFTRFEGGANTSLAEVLRELMHTAEFVLLALNVYSHYREEVKNVGKLVQSFRQSQEFVSLNLQCPHVPGELKSEIVEIIEDRAE